MQEKLEKFSCLFNFVSFMRAFNQTKLHVCKLIYSEKVTKFENILLRKVKTKTKWEIFSNCVAFSENLQYFFEKDLATLRFSNATLKCISPVALRICLPRKYCQYVVPKLICSTSNYI